MYRIAIVTYKRPITIKNKTLAYLKRANIDFNKIDVFISDISEYNEYKESLKDYPEITLVKGKIGVHNNRNFIVDYYPKDQFVFGIDDDIESLGMRLSAKKVIELTDLDSFLNNAFNLAKGRGLNLWGIYPVYNPFFMKNNCTVDLKFICACCYGWINTKEQKSYVTIENKEDYERTLNHYIADGGVMRFNHIAPKTKYYVEKGGMQETRTKEKEAQSADWLKRKYPQYVKTYISKRGYKEIRLRKYKK